MAEIAVAILNFNGEEHLKTFLPSILRYSSPAEIIVGDNASTDNSVALLKDEFPDVTLIELAENYGYAGGYNKLIAQIDAEYIVLVNSDIEVTENWLQPLVAILDKDSSVAAVQPKILSYLNQEYFEYAGAGGGYMDKFGYPFCRGRVFSHLEEDRGQYDDERFVFWASGACFLLRKSSFEEVGGFDQSFFAHMEEIDLDWRLQKAGYTIKYTGKSMVYHLGGGTLAYDNPRKTYLNFRNGWMMLIKNYVKGSRFSIFLRRYLLDLISILFFLVQFKVMSALAIIKAHLFILSYRPKGQDSKAEHTAEAKNNYKIGPESYSIVWQYFIARKKRYSDL